MRGLSPSACAMLTINAVDHELYGDMHRLHPKQVPDKREVVVLPDGLLAARSFRNACRKRR